MNVLTVDDQDSRHDGIAYHLRKTGERVTITKRYATKWVTDADLSDADLVFLDHDMCEAAWEGHCPNPEDGGPMRPLAPCGCPTGHDLAKRMAALPYRPAVVVHSANAVGSEGMVDVLRRAGFRVVAAPPTAWRATDWRKVAGLVVASPDPRLNTEIR